MIKSTFNLENKLISKGYDFIIGIDEAGRGPLAGPVVAAATLCRNFQFPISNFQKNPKSPNPKYKIRDIKYWDLIRDSKTLSAKQREKLFDFIHEHFHVGVGVCDHKTIDRINILQATYLAVKKSLTDLFNKINQETRYNNQINSKFQISNSKQIANLKSQNPKIIILFDGNKKIPSLSIKQKTVINGDETIKSISAASIIAKVARDRMMIKMHKQYPRYGFHKHKGYGTKLHMDMLKKHGPCKIHRRSFRPVSKYL